MRHLIGIGLAIGLALAQYRRVVEAGTLTIQVDAVTAGLVHTLPGWPPYRQRSGPDYSGNLALRSPA